MVAGVALAVQDRAQELGARKAAPCQRGKLGCEIAQP